MNISILMGLEPQLREGIVQCGASAAGADDEIEIV